MDTKTFAQPEPTEGKASRLPAGSTLEVNGIHVPHPHADANLAGQGDTRLGNTDAVTEKVTVDADGNTKVESGPLSDDVKPRRLTTDPDAQKLGEVDAPATAPAVHPALELKTDPINKVVEEQK